MPNAKQKFNLASQTTALIHQSYADYAKKFGLNYNELMVLYVLFTEQICTQKQIGTIRELPKQTVHNICKKWIDSDVIQVLDNTQDKREKNLTLSPKGIAMASEVIEPLLHLENQCLTEIGNENMDLFLSHFTNIAQIISKNISSFGTNSL